MNMEKKQEYKLVNYAAIMISIVEISTVRKVKYPPALKQDYSTSVQDVHLGLKYGRWVKWRLQWLNFEYEMAEEDIVDKGELNMMCNFTMYSQITAGWSLIAEEPHTDH